MTEIDKLANEHAWRYFELHAQQRMTVFNFYIAITGLLAAGVGFSLQQGESYIYLCPIMGFFMAFISFIFWKLDERVSMLIKNAESVLRDIENKFQNPDYFILKKDHYDKKLNSSLLSSWSYGQCFRVAFLCVGNIGLVVIIVSISMTMLK